MRRGWPALIAAVVLNVGCSAVRPAVHESRHFEIDPAQCVTDVAQIPATPLPAASATEAWRFSDFAFEKIAHCARASDGSLVPMAVFATSGNVPIEVRIELMVGASIAFAAAVDLLDSDYRLLRTIPFADFSRRGGSYTGSVFLNAKEAAVRHLVLRPDSESVGTVHSSTSGIGSVTPYVIPIPGGIIYGSVASGTEQIVKTWLSEVGSFRIAARAWQPSEFGVARKPTRRGSAR